MAGYEIHRDLATITVTKNGTEFLVGRLRFGWSGFGFSLCDREGVQYDLKSKGVLLWRKLRLFRNGVRWDDYKLYKSLGTGVQLERVELVYIGDTYAFTLSRHSAPSTYGKLLYSYSWSTEDQRVEIAIIVILLLELQNFGGPSGAGFF